MELSLPIYERLSKHKLLGAEHATKINETRKKVLLTKDGTAFFENGVILSKWLSLIKQAMQKDTQSSKLKPAHTPAAKLYNWNILVKELDVSPSSQWLITPL